MVVYLEGLSGQATGQRYKVWDGLRVGRSIGEVLIDDPKVSSLHAQFETDARGNLVLVDKDSANGLRINGQKVKRIALLLGVNFQIGKTSMRVAEINREEIPPQPAAAPEKRDWKKFLLGHLPNLTLQNTEALQKVQAFRPALQLNFVEGIQYEERLILGYGPRRFGADSLDIELADPLSPPTAFEILCENGEAVFKTEFPRLVLLNNQPIRESSLKEGDTIRIGQTLIKVGFAE